MAMIFWPIRPALPMPETITLPRHSIEVLDRLAKPGRPAAWPPRPGRGFPFGSLAGRSEAAPGESAGPAPCGFRAHRLVILDRGRVGRGPEGNGWGDCTTAGDLQQCRHLRIAWSGGSAGSGSGFGNRVPRAVRSWSAGCPAGGPDRSAIGVPKAQRALLRALNCLLPLRRPDSRAIGATHLVSHLMRSVLLAQLHYSFTDRRYAKA